MKNRFINVVVSGMPAFKAGHNEIIWSKTSTEYDVRRLGDDVSLYKRGSSRIIRRLLWNSTECSWWVVETRESNEINGYGRETHNPAWEMAWPVKGHTLTSFEPDWSRAIEQPEY